MIEYLYKLNLPLFEGVAKQEFLNQIDTIKVKDYLYFNTSDVLKPEFLSIQGANLVTCLSFFKNKGETSLIHCDPINDSNIVWGINWIQSGIGGFEVWDEADLPDATLVDTDVPPYRKYKTWPDNQIKPKWKYIMPPGAYLVCASVPHRGSSIEDRFCFSIRSSNYRLCTWSDVVNLFNPIIDKSYTGVP